MMYFFFPRLSYKDNGWGIIIIIIIIIITRENFSVIYKDNTKEFDAWLIILLYRRSRIHNTDEGCNNEFSSNSFSFFSKL